MTLRISVFALGLTMLLAAGSAPARAAAPASVSATTPDGYVKVGFDLLAAYTFTPPPYDPTASKPATGEEQIPSAVKALSGRKAVVTGYMVPVKIEKGLVTEFLLMRNTMACCFGGTPNMNEWVIVRMRPGVQPLMDTPVSFYGPLKVGALFDNGYLTGLYEMDAERMEQATEVK